MNILSLKEGFTMVTFISSIIILILGYIFYGKYVERVFEIHPDKQTPAYSKQDNMDFVPMPAWKGWMIQLLNIAGLADFWCSSWCFIWTSSIYLDCCRMYRRWRCT